MITQPYLLVNEESVKTYDVGDRLFWSVYDSLIPELCQHLQHVYANLLRIVVQTGADDAEAIRCQYPAMQLVSLVLLVLLIFLVRYLLHGNLRSSRTTGICQMFFCAVR